MSSCSFDQPRFAKQQLKRNRLPRILVLSLMWLAASVAGRGELVAADEPCMVDRISAHLETN